MNKDNNGFIACPFCGRTDKVVAWAEQFFYELQDKHGGAGMMVECKRCHVEMWDFSCSVKNYEKRVDILRLKWNKRAAVSHETEGDDEV